jgi:divalent metal cation (Fe/Co/Zn/Cd) transporter
VTRDLRLLRHALQLRERKGLGTLDGALDDQTIRGEVSCNEIRVARVRRRGESIHAKVAIDVVIAVFASQAARPDQKVVESLSRREDAPNVVVVVECRTDRPATRERRRSRGEKKPSPHCG